LKEEYKMGAGLAIGLITSFDSKAPYEALNED